MFTLGLGLTFSDFACMQKFFNWSYKPINISSFGRFIVFIWPSELAIGLILIAAAPGGVTYSDFFCKRRCSFQFL